MSVLLDILGAVIIGGLVLIMLISFNAQLRQTAERNMYAAQVTENMESACMRLNYLIGLAGAGLHPEKAVVVADEQKFRFRTYWNFEKDKLEEEGYFLNQVNPIEVTIQKAEEGAATGISILILREGVEQPVEDLGYIFWVDDLSFRYYDIDGKLVSNASAGFEKQIRSLDIFLTFRRPGPLMGDPPLINRLQLRCFMMNAYMQEGLAA